LRQKECDEELRKFVKYSDINPCQVIIFDDYLPIAKLVEKKIELLFVEGRHYNITTILSAQRFMGICTTARQNAFFSIFTQLTQFHLFLKERSQQYSKDTIQKIKQYVQDVIQNDEKYTVLIHDEYDDLKLKKVSNITKKKIELYIDDDIVSKMSHAMKFVIQFEKKKNSQQGIDQICKKIMNN
jgi:hypothetical protein